MLYAIVVVIILIADQFVKLWSSSNLMDQGVKEFIPGFLQLRYVENPGAAFGMFTSMNFRWGFVAIAAIFAIVIIVAMRKGWIYGKGCRWMATLVLAGALGNMIDRIIHKGGYVVDTFEFAFKIFNKDFPVFNVADIFIVIGGILFCIAILLQKDPEPDSRVMTGRGGSVITTPPSRKRTAPAAAPKRQASEPVRRRPPTADIDDIPDISEVSYEDFPAREVVSRPSQAVPQRQQRPRPQAESAAPRSQTEPATPRRQAEPAAPRSQAEPATAPRRRTAPAPGTAPAPESIPTTPVPSPAAEPVKSVPSPRPPIPANSPLPQRKPASSSDSFDLDDIMAEFKDM